MVATAAPDHHGGVPGGPCGPLAVQVVVEGAAHGVVAALGGAADQVALDHPPRAEHLARLVHRRARDEGTAVGDELDHVIGGQPRQGGADARSADPEVIAEFVFLEMRAGQELVIHDCVEDAPVYLIRIHLRRGYCRAVADLRLTIRFTIHSTLLPTAKGQRPLPQCATCIRLHHENVYDLLRTKKRIDRTRKLYTILWTPTEEAVLPHSNTEKTMTLKTRLKTGLAVGAVAALLAGASGANTLRMADSTDIAAMDPHSMTESNTIGFLNHVYEGLVRYNQNLEVEPALATSWEFVEPTRLRFTLREGVTYHNGNPFTADDVVDSLERAAHEMSPVKSNIPGMKSVEKVDEYTVDLILAGPDPIVLNYLTNIFVLDREWMAEHNALMPADMRGGRENYAVANSNGTGPFTLESRQPDARTVLTVNDGWWDEPEHNLTRIEFSPIGSDATRIAALLSGELDFITPAPLQDIDRIDRAEGANVIVAPALRTIMLGLNQNDKLFESNLTDENPLQDKRVREALWMAIDMELIREKIMRGMSRNSALLVAPPVPGYDAALDVLPPADPEAARALLDEAGYGDGFEVGLDCPNSRYVNDEEICQAITAMWSRLGVEARLNAQTKSKHFEKVLTGDTDIYMVGWATLPMLDTYSVLSALLHTPGDRMGAWNPAGYSNPEIDDLTTKIATELDPEKRTAMMTEALEIARDDVAMIPLHQQPLAWAVQDGVNIPITADNKPRLWYATVD